MNKSIDCNSDFNISCWKPIKPQQSLCHVYYHSEGYSASDFDSAAEKAQHQLVTCQIYTFDIVLTRTC